MNRISLQKKNCIAAMLIATSTMPKIGSAEAAEESFYKRPAMFRHTRPNEKAASQVIGRFGPVGMAIELRLPPFQMYIKSVEEGSPAEATGKLKPGQKIDSINGRVLKDIDPRITLGNIITEAEAADGKVKLMIRDTEDGEPYEVVVQIPVLGAYSETWPLDCPKSDRIVRNMADYLAENGSFPFPEEVPEGVGGPTGVCLPGFGALFLLSTGEEKDLNVVRGWMDEVVEQTKDYERIQMKPWDYAAGAIPIAEYYLRTGDKRVLTIIKGLADHAKNTMFNGGWSGRGGLVFGYAGCGGHMNAAGVHVATFLLLARECGVKVDEFTLRESLKNFYRYAGRGSLGYGDNFPETYFIDNGKTSALAYTMAAAASLTPVGENSVYAGARDICAMRSFYGTSYMNVGHTGGGIGECWRGPAMGYLYKKKPQMYRGFMDGRRWHLELSRRFDGSIGVLDGGRYDNPGAWGRMYALQYTFPRQTLQISGAPDTRYCHSYKLPERPWGTAEDDDFYRIQPAALPDGTIPEFDNTLKGGTIGGIEASLRGMRDDGGIPADVTFKYGHHPEHEVRREIFGFYRTQELDDEIAEMLKHEDARVRRAALTAIHHVHKGTHTLPSERLTDEMVDIVIKMVNDDKESWWVVENALRVLSIVPKEKVAPHLDRLLYWLQHDEWWLQSSALNALAPLAADERYCDRILPVVGEMIVNNTHAPFFNAVQKLASQLAGADSEKVRDTASRIFVKAYQEFPSAAEPPAGKDAYWALKKDLASHFPTISLRSIAHTLRTTPAGYAQLLKLARERQPNMLADYMTWIRWMDTADSSPEVRQEMETMVRDLIIPDYVARNLDKLQRGPKGVSAETVTWLAELYAKIGQDEYLWHDFGPQRDKMKFHYYSFDPKEKKPWKPGQVRYRRVTFPAGMETWYKPDFDPVNAGWQTGFAPFGQVEGKLRTEQGGGCSSDICRCGDPMNTLWEKEVLLLKGTFKFPEMKPGHSYRLLAGGAVHVGDTDGPVVYLNGKRVFSAVRGIRRFRGGRPRGILLNPKQIEQFNSGEVDISAICFLRQDKRTLKKGNFLTIFVQEMKNPPFTKEMARKGRMRMTQEPMECAAWQALQDPESQFASDDPNEGKYLYDGDFVNNPLIIGSWTLVGQVDKPENFDHTAMANPTVRPFDDVVFKEKGYTDSLDRFWSGNRLMNVVTKEAMRIDASHVKKTGHLLIEAGGFSPKHPNDWKPPWLVFEKMQ